MKCCAAGLLWGELLADSENSFCFTANYVATGQTVVYIATTLVNLLPSIFQVCVCLRYPTVPQPSGRLVVLRGKSQPQVQSRLIVPGNHTAHPYRDIHTLFSVVPLLREKRGGLILIAVCGSLERGQDYWGLLVDPRRC